MHTWKVTAPFSWVMTIRRDPLALGFSVTPKGWERVSDSQRDQFSQQGDRVAGVRGNL